VALRDEFGNAVTDAPPSLVVAYLNHQRDPGFEARFTEANGTACALGGPVYRCGAVVAHVV